MPMDFTHAIVEQLGHRRFVGRVSEEMLAGAVMLRIEAAVTDEDPFSGEVRYGPPLYIAGASLFAVTPTTEDAIRKELQEASDRRAREREQRAEWARRHALTAGDGDPSDPLDDDQDEDDEQDEA